MDKISELISKIMEQNEQELIKDIEVDLKRVMDINFGKDAVDYGYIDYLFKYYQNEINYIDSLQTTTQYNPVIFNNITKQENIRNYLIKIAILRIVPKKGINMILGNIHDIDYCIKLFDKKL